jgi:hypothetical protein
MYACQGCQMVYFQARHPNAGKFWRILKWKVLVSFMGIWSILRTISIFYALLVNFRVFWSIFSCSGILSQEKSGNPEVCIQWTRLPIRFFAWGNKALLRNELGGWFYENFSNKFVIKFWTNPLKQRIQMYPTITENHLGLWVILKPYEDITTTLNLAKIGFVRKLRPKPIH